MMSWLGKQSCDWLPLVTSSYLPLSAAFSVACCKWYDGVGGFNFLDFVCNY